MKKKLIYIAYIFVLALLVSCEEYLEEEPKSDLTAQYLESAGGVNAALNSAYSDLRYFYGGESALNVTCSGTDTWQKGPDGSTAFNFWTDEIPSNGQTGTTWNWGYRDINTCNAVIKYAASSDLTEDEAARREAEARYIRATWYFIIVQVYGPCVLNTEFITEPSSVAERASVTEVYDLIIEDLEFAMENLPPVAEETGRADGAAARHLLADVYLTRATHEEAGQPDDYQMAYDLAMELIDNNGTYGLALLEDYADIHEPLNEHNSEVIFTVERNQDPLFNDIDPNDDGNKNNRSSFFFRPHYEVCTSFGGLARTLEYGRPWIRVRPTNWLLQGAFAEREDDTRYHKIFQTVWLVNDESSLTNASFSLGDTAIWLPGTENYVPGQNVMNTYPPSQYYDNESNGTVSTVKIYPSMNKYDDPNRPAVNDASTRPFIVHKFSETYLIAAEAAMYLGMAEESVELLSVIRARAAYHADRTASANANARQRMINAIPNMTDLDEGITFILDERARELCGEYMRYFDLVRTRTTSGEVQLLHRVRNLEPAIPCQDDIKDHNVLYPIPQSQFDLTENDFGENNGY